MTVRWCFYYFRVFCANLFSARTLLPVLTAFGALWLTVEIAVYFFPTTIVRGTTSLPNYIRDGWWLFLAAGLAYGAWARRPCLSVSCKLQNRDVSIEIVVGDIMSLSGALIIGSNTTFDTNMSDVISDKSVQGLFTKKYYNSAVQMDTEVTAGLGSERFDELIGERVGKGRRYALGTCVVLHPRERTGYLLGIADINEHGTASGTFDQLKESLAKLWVYIGARGIKEPLLIPILGTGFTRLPQSREEIAREIINSFLAACSERNFTDKLTIVIKPHDMLSHQISLDELGSFLRHQCKYTMFSSNSRPPLGTAA